MSYGKICWCRECRKDEHDAEIASLKSELETARQDNRELVRQYNELVAKVEGKNVKN